MWATVAAVMCAADLDQSAGFAGADTLNMEWQRINTAPFDRDLELAVIDYGGVHALVCMNFCVLSMRCLVSSAIISSRLLPHS